MEQATSKNMTMANYYALGHARHVMHSAEKASKNLLSKAKLKLYFGISPKKYAKLLKEYTPLYLQQTKIETKISNIDWAILPLFESGRKKELNKKTKERTKLREEEKKIDKKLKAIEKELEKHKGLSTSHII